MKKQIDRIQEAVEYMSRAFRTYGGQDVSGKVYEILNPPNPDEFLECDACRAKPGSPVLCQGCLHNRNLIERLK